MLARAEAESEAPALPLAPEEGERPLLAEAAPEELPRLLALALLALLGELLALLCREAEEAALPEAEAPELTEALGLSEALALLLTEG